MCEYCGCQAVTAIDLLTREHDRALDHVRAAEQAARREDPASAQDACRQLAAVLEPHTAVEEQSLFPALEADFADQMELLRHEHRLVASVLDEVAGDGPLSSGWQVRVKGAMSLLRRHILKEQDGVFPAALATLTVAEWERVDQARTAVGTALPALAIGASS
jgi:hemerythrin-like domain-containing protein